MSLVNLLPKQRSICGIRLTYASNLMSIVFTDIGQVRFKDAQTAQRKEIMLKGSLAVMVVVLAGLLNAGCEAQSTSALSGRWVEKTQDQGKHPRVLTIAAEDDTYRVDEEIYLNGQYKTQREIGQPVSKTVIAVKNGLRNIRLENGVIIYRNLEFVKAG